MNCAAWNVSGREAVGEKKVMLPRRRLSHTGGGTKGAGGAGFHVGRLEDFGKIKGWPSVVKTQGSSPLCNGWSAKLSVRCSRYQNPLKKEEEKKKKSTIIK